MFIAGIGSAGGLEPENECLFKRDSRNMRFGM